MKVDERVAVEDFPELPAFWTGTDEGASYIWKDYLCVITKEPNYYLEAFENIGIPSLSSLTDTVNKIKEYHKSIGFKYLYSMACFKKDSTNGTGFESARASAVYSIETSQFLGNGASIHSFLPNKTSFSLGECIVPPNSKEAAKILINSFTNNDYANAQYIGTMKDGYKHKTGKEIGGSGCLGIITAFVFLPTAVYIVTHLS